MKSFLWTKRYKGLKKSDNKLIFIGRLIDFDEEQFLIDLKHLIDESYKNKDNIKELTAEICEGYTITNN